MGNYTKEAGFILNAFSDNGRFHVLFFLVFLIIYLVTVVGNILILLLSKVDCNLHTPMYFFLSNLSFMDMCYTNTTIPKMLLIILLKHSAISLPACATQLYCFLSLAASESSLLALMAYDRYVAICNPLRYTSIMNKEVCLQMAAGTWIIGCIYGAIHTSNTFRLHFCGSKILNHYFCDIPPLLNISCNDTFFVEMTVFVVGGFLMLGCFVLILGSYVHILISVLKIPKTSGRGKTFSICASHLVVVLLYYGSGSTMYLRPKSKLVADKQWLLSIFYANITPLLNPIIYSLRNKDIKRAFLKWIK
ncbi:olfactory receptor 1030 [Xenopus laevis]|uniref:Olfactory receptor n=2 Tax=Xenopus laevis TaxID=8355 RepID=A0A974I549_XENLA|nr:olfactory receptor 1030 [Xenopus laevis]OCU01569.1 hypothetical protein XELAEV_18007360mg [Xenopus laevis]